VSRLLDRFRRPDVDLERDLGSLADQAMVWSQSWYPGQTSEAAPGNFQAFVDEGYKSNGIVFAVMLVRLLTFSQAEFKFQQLSDRRLFGNTDLALVESPWPNGSTGELLARMIQDVDLAGNFYAVYDQEHGYLERLRPDWVSIVLTESGEVQGYAYCEGGAWSGGSMEFYLPADVAHWSPIPDPVARWRGMSPMSPVVREIAVDTRLTDYKTKYLDNAATPNLLVKYPQQLTAQQVDELRQRFAARHGGSSKAFKTMLLDRGADATVVGSTFEQMNLKTVQGAGETRIAAAFGVPPVIVGLSEGLEAATYSNYELAMRRFSDLTMVPLWQSAAKALESLVKVPVGSRLWYDVGHMPALRQTEKDRADTMQTFANAAGELIRSGFDPMTVAAALHAGDVTLLSHTGAIPTALYPNGQAPMPPRAEPLVVISDGAIRTEVHTPPVEANTTIHDGAIRNETTLHPDTDRLADAMGVAAARALEPVQLAFEVERERGDARDDELMRSRESQQQQTTAVLDLVSRISARRVKKIVRDESGEIAEVIETIEEQA
jgi:HK97 family phage portal protein